MKIADNMILASDGATYALGDFSGRIEHVELEWGGDVEAPVGLPKDEMAFITSILVVADKPLAALPDLGTLVFSYNAQGASFAAPVVALMNRYHGLTTLQGVVNRMRALVNPAAAKADLLTDGFHNGIMDPIRMNAFLRYYLRHEPPKVSPAWAQALENAPKPKFTVEVQMLTTSDRIAPLWGKR